MTCKVLSIYCIIRDSFTMINLHILYFMTSAAALGYMLTDLVSIRLNYIKDYVVIVLEYSCICLSFLHTIQQLPYRLLSLLKCLLYLFALYHPLRPVQWFRPHLLYW